MPDGAIMRATHTPIGVGVELLRVDHAAGEVEQQTWGAGGEWLIDRLPRLFGDDDETAAQFRPPDLLAATAARYPGWRVGQTDAIAEAAAAAVLEQKVTGKEAWFGWRYLVRKFGERIDIADVTLYAPPTRRAWLRIPSWEWHQASVDGSRSRALMALVRAVPEFATAEDFIEVKARMMAVHGIGRWTVAEVAQQALGDADAISFGDYHLAKQIVYAYTGRRNGTDEELAELLEPYLGHRYRIQRLFELSGLSRPRRGPRMSVADMRSF
jgi:3-methyladenine DNA glycosylase/8-oxoguanine DNA glycosylase